MLCSGAFDAQTRAPLSVPVSLAVASVSVRGRVSCRVVYYLATVRHDCAANGARALDLGRMKGPALPPELWRMIVCVGE